MEEKNASSSIPDSYGEGMVFPKTIALRLN